jgi:hypothetical protein
MPVIEFARGCLAVVHFEKAANIASPRTDASEKANLARVRNDLRSD